MTSTHLHIELVLFGPPRLRLGGVAARLGSRKALALRAVLALDGARSREQLAALLWPDFDAAAARRNLRRDLFRLREIGLPLEEPEDGAVALAMPLVRQDPLPADGPPLQGLDGIAGEDFDAWLARSRAVLDTRRSAHQRDLARAAQERGDDSEALRRLEALLDADPCDESAALQAAALLQRRGEQARAQATVRRLTLALREQLGLPASPALQAVLGQVDREADVAPTGSSPGRSARQASAPASRAHTPLIPLRTPYLVRAHEQAQVLAAWARGARVYLSGAAGVGKSRLAHELAASAGGWLHLACQPNDALVPYSSAVRALRSLRDAAADVELPPWVQRERRNCCRNSGHHPRCARPRSRVHG